MNCMEPKSKFANLLEQKYLKWQIDQGQRKTLDEFASYIGISRPLVSMWMTDKQTPGEKMIARLVSLFGQEIYDSLDIPRPDPLLYEINEKWSTFSDDQRAQIEYIIHNKKDEPPPPPPKNDQPLKEIKAGKPALTV